MLLIALLTIVVLILLVLFGVLNPNTGETIDPNYMVTIRAEARAMDRMIHHVKVFGMENRYSIHDERERILFLYLMNLSGDDEVLNHRLTLAFEWQDAEEIATLLGFPSQGVHLRAWLYENKK